MSSHYQQSIHYIHLTIFLTLSYTVATFNNIESHCKYFYNYEKVEGSISLFLDQDECAVGQKGMVTSRAEQCYCYSFQYNNNSVLLKATINKLSVPT